MSASPTTHPLVRTHYVSAYTVNPDANQDGGVDWFVEADLADPETDRMVTFSASLTFALQMGTFSHPWEREITPSVLEKMDALAGRLAAAGLY